MNALSLPELARQINAAHRECEAAIKSGFEHKIEAGRLLLKAKELCQHGEWSAWLKSNFVASERTAQVYMRISRNSKMIDSKTQHAADFSLRDALHVLDGPCDQYSKAAGLLARADKYLMYAMVELKDAEPQDRRVLLAVHRCNELSREALETLRPTRELTADEERRMFEVGNAIFKSAGVLNSFIDGHVKKMIQSMKPVAEALITIRDQKLYRDKFNSFEEYCCTRWGAEIFNALKDYEEELVRA